MLKSSLMAPPSVNVLKIGALVLFTRLQETVISPCRTIGLLAAVALPLLV